MRIILFVLSTILSNFQGSKVLFLAYKMEKMEITEYLEQRGIMMSDEQVGNSMCASNLAVE